MRGQPFQRMAEAVEERSGGSIRCEFHPGNELGGAADTVEMISGGANILQTVSADFTSDYGCPDMMLCNIFYTFDSVEKTLEFSNSDIFKGMCDKVAEGGIKVLNLAWIEAPRQLMSTRPVQSFADLKGLKVRVPGFVYADFWDACGAVGTSVGLSDAYSALSSGILEATETNLESLYSYSMQEVCPYCTLTAHTTAPGCFLMSQKIWEELTPEQQTIMSEEAYNAGLWFSEQQLEGQDIAKKALEEAGVTFYTLSDEDMAALKQVALEQVKSYVTTYDLTDGLYEQIVAFLADRPTFTDPQNGSRVLLTERMFGLGGLATLGLIVVYLPICDGMGRQVCHGIAEELLRLSIRHGWEDRYPSAWLEPGMEAKRRDQRFEVQYNGQVFAVLMEQLLRESGVEILYGTSVCGVAKSGDVIDGIFIENKSGRQFIRGRAFVDATGDADLCALVGEETVVNTAGNPLAAWYYETIDGEYKLRVFGVSDLVRPGEEAPAISSARFVGLDGRELSEMVCSSHEKSLEDHLKKGGVSRRHALSTLASIPMIRMTRRLRGIHELGEQEAFTHFQDSIGMVSDWRKAGPVYEVPFSALHGKHCRNLAVAGRCVSAAGDMWDIMRVIPPCAVKGQAAGLAASISADLPQIDIELLQQKLRDSGVKLHTDELEPLAERQ